MHHVPHQVQIFPRWFRAALVVLATVVLCACQSTSPISPHAGGSVQVAEAQGGPHQFPVQQIQYTSQEWLDNVPTTPYDGPVAPCSCHGCQSGGPMPTYAACPTCPGGGPAAGSPCGPGDGVIGPSDEYLCDGGDFHSPAGVGYDWEIHGLEQEDTITHYDTVDGRVIVKPSNRVCIYAPRFGAVRKVDNLIVNHHRVGPGGIIDKMALAGAERTDVASTTLEQKMPLASLGDQPPNLFRSRVQAGGVQTRIAAADLETFLGPQLAMEVMKVGIIDNSEKPRLAKAIVSAITWASDVGAQVVVDSLQLQQQIGRTQAGEVYGLDEPDSPRIRLIKCASTGAAELGEEVEFALRYDNVGDQPIGNVTIVDNLATRLEYVPDSAKSSRDAQFFTEPNEGGSLVLRWEIAEPLNPGEGGVLRFKARVR